MLGGVEKGVKEYRKVEEQQKKKCWDKLKEKRQCGVVT